MLPKMEEIGLSAAGSATAVSTRQRGQICHGLRERADEVPYLLLRYLLSSRGQLGKAAIGEAPAVERRSRRVASLTTDDSYSVAEATPVPSEANRAASVS